MGDKISDLTNLPTVTSTDVLPIVSGGVTYKITQDNLIPDATPTVKGKVAMLDEDTMASNSATKTATQQSIKAYVDNTSVVKATGTEINTGTDDAKFATAKAIADSNLAFLSDITIANLSNPYKMRASLGSNQANIGTSETVVQLNTEQYDINSNFNTGTYGYTVPVTGYYHVEGSAYFYDVMADQEPMQLYIYADSTMKTRNQMIAAAANAGHTLKVSDILYLTAGQVVNMRVKMSTTTTTDIYNDATLTYMAIHLLSV